MARASLKHKMAVRKRAANRTGAPSKITLVIRHPAECENEETTDDEGLVGAADKSDPAYEPAHPRDLSLASCRGDDEQAVAIVFESLIGLELGFHNLTSAWDWSQNCTPLYHAHLQWHCAVRITRVPGDTYVLALVSVGPTPTQKQVPGDLHGPNLLGQPAPIPSAAKLTIADDAGEDREELALVGPTRKGGFTVTRRFTKKELLCLAIPDGRLLVRLRITIPRAYFDLASIIDLTEEPTVSEHTQDTVETILRGEKPARANWEIMGGAKSCSTVFYVHKDIFSRFSAGIRVALVVGVDGPSVNVEVANDGRRGRLNKLNDGLVRLAICIAYGVEVPLPAKSAGLYDLRRLFGDHFTTVVVPQWQRELCRSALAIDLHDSSAALAALSPLLDVAFGAPTEWFPIARSVVIGALASVAHINISSTTAEFIRETVMPALFKSGACDTVPAIVEELTKLMNTVPNVAKWALDAAGEPNEPEDEDGFYNEVSLAGAPCSCSIS